MTEDELAIVRRAYAKQVMAIAGLDDPRLEDCLAELHREDFLGPGPWKILRWPSGYRDTPSADPVFLYQDTLVAILPQKTLNNGQPSFLAFLISLGRLAEGEHAVHIGAGVGYYTAVLARLAGESGRVTAIEYEPELAERATANLAAYPNVRVIGGDGTAIPLDKADFVFVNAGAAQPAAVWLDALNEGGRLVLPLTASFQNNQGHTVTRGAIFLVERMGDEFRARKAADTMIYPCSGLRDPASDEALAKAFQAGGAESVRRLYRSDDLPEKNCWVRGAGWALAYE